MTKLTTTITELFSHEYKTPTVYENSPQLLPAGDGIWKFPGCKPIIPWKSGQLIAEHWGSRQIEITDYNSVWDNLLKVDAFSFWVNAPVKKGIHPDFVRKAKYPKNGKAGGFDHGYESHMIVIDVDELDMPEELWSWEDPEGCAMWGWHHVTEICPALSGCEYIWEASSSANLKKDDKYKKCKMHYIVLLDEKMDGKDMQQLFKIMNIITPDIVDDSMADDTRALFVGDIYVHEDCEHPLPEGRRGRCNVGQGHASASALMKWLDDNKDEEKVNKKTRQHRQAMFNAKAGVSKFADFQNELVTMPPGQRHDGCYRLGIRMGFAVLRGSLSESEYMQLTGLAESLNPTDRHHIQIENGISWALQNHTEYDLKQHVGKKESNGWQTRQDTKDAIDAFIDVVRKRGPDDDPTRMMITGTAGQGKTSALTGYDGQPGALHSLHGKIVVMFFPGHEKCEEELQNQIENAKNVPNAPNATVARGRTHPDKNGNTLCKIPEIVEEYGQKKGQNVYSNVCMRCPFKEDCKYLNELRDRRQQIDASSGLVIFAPHQYLSSSIQIIDEDEGNEKLKSVKPDLMIVDEGISMKMTCSKTSIKRDELRTQFLDGFGEVSYYPFSIIDKKDKNGDYVPACTDTEMKMRIEQYVLQALDKISEIIENEQWDNALYLLEHQGIDKKFLKNALDTLNDLEDTRMDDAVKSAFNEFRKSDMVSKFANSVSSMENTLNKGGVAALFKSLHDEMGKNKHATGTFMRASTYNVKNEDTGKNEEITVEYVKTNRLRKLQYMNKDSDLLILDATGQHRMTEMQFDTELAHGHFPCEIEAEMIHVIPSPQMPFSVRSLTYSENAERNRQDLLNVIEREQFDCIIGPLKAIKAMGLHGDPRVVHFGALRGLNKFKDKKNMLIFGSNRPPLDAIEDYAACFASALVAKGENVNFTRFITEDEQRKFSKGSRVVNTVNGDVAISSFAHSDDLCNMVIDALSPSESNQAAGRIRAIDCGPGKRITTIGNIPLDATYSKTVPWSQYKKQNQGPLEECFELGVVPLGGSFAFNCMHDIWKVSARRINDILKDAEISKDTIDDSNDMRIISAKNKGYARIVNVKIPESNNMQKFLTLKPDWKGAILTALDRKIKIDEDDISEERMLEKQKMQLKSEDGIEWKIDEEPQKVSGSVPSATEDMMEKKLRRMKKHKY